MVKTVKLSRLILFIVLIAFFLNSCAHSADKVFQGRNPYLMLETSMIEVHGVSTRYVDRGQGETVLLIHGFPETLQGWRKNVPEFAANYRVVALDVVGFGGTDKVDWGFSCVRLGEFVKAFMDKLGIAKAHVIGTDTGSLIALALAANYPEKTGKLILFSGGGSEDSISAVDVRMMIKPVLGEFGFLLLGPLTLKMGIKKGFYRPENIEREIIKEYTTYLSSWRSRRLALKLMRHLGDGYDGVMEKLKAHPPPTLILWAEHEKYFYSWVP
ncbi:MAG: alpha/beta hydrolase [Candidatus Omnitrophica bacterium]|nr:alpha/beta hydrolase [Candidatus Omnitrophota bacterium]